MNRPSIRNAATALAAPVDTNGAESLVSVNILKGGGRFGREFHMGKDPVVEMKYEDGVTTIHLTFTDRNSEVKVCWAMSDQQAKLLGNRL